MLSEGNEGGGAGLFLKISSAESESLGVKKAKHYLSAHFFFFLKISQKESNEVFKIFSFAPKGGSFDPSSPHAKPNTHLIPC